MNSVLTAPVTTEEIKHAAFSIKGSSAPGENALMGVFYQEFWHIVGPSLVSEIQKFLSTAILPNGWNHTQPCLLPKIPNPSRMKDMRPISLCPVQYKNISKILCDRLKPFLPVIISKTQAAVVSDRLITYNIIMANEMVHGLHTSDRVEWCFIETLLEKLGFDRVWIRWMSTALVNCLNQAEATGKIQGMRLATTGPAIQHLFFADDSLLM